MSYRDPYDTKGKLIVGAIIAVLFAVGYGVKELIDWLF